MRIYFGFTVAGDRGSLAAARRMVALIEELGHEVLTRHLVSDKAGELDRKLGPRHIYERDLEWLRQCDMFIGEVSGSSFGLGFEAGYLLGATTKEVILFYHAESAHKISLMITGNSHLRCTVVPYIAFEEVEACLRRRLKEHGASQADIQASGDTPP